MRRFFALVTLVALAACGGGGGHGTSALPSSPGGGPAYTGATEKPTFTIRIPPHTSSAKFKRIPQTVSRSTMSVVITLTGDSIGVDPTTITGYSAETDISGATCSSGCTVSGPPSPIGSDTFSIITYDTAGGTGNALDSSYPTLTIAQGVNNSESITLDGVVAHIYVSQPQAITADQTSSATVFGNYDAIITANTLVVATDAQNNIISGNYANPITLSDPDTLPNGTTVTSGSCSFPGNNSGSAATTAVLATSSATATLCYGGEAENPVTLTASAAGVTFDPVNNVVSVVPQLNAPVETAGSATPTGVASDSGEIDLFTTSGFGSTGSITYTEAGWTDAPYNQSLAATASSGGTDCTQAGPFSTYATVVDPPSTSGTTFTVTAIGSPAAGDCPLTIGDGLSSNGTDQPAQLVTTYTTTGFGINAVHRRPPAVVKIKH